MRVEAYIPRDDKWAKFEHMSQGGENLREVVGYLFTPYGRIKIRLIDETIEESNKGTTSSAAAREKIDKAG